MSHTPGPWDVDTSYLSIVAREMNICEIYDDCGPQQYIANARLIAAAPDLLEALEACLAFIPCSTIRSWPPGFALKDKALALTRAALAKAKGVDVANPAG